MFLFGPPNVEKMKARRDVNGLIKALGYKKDEYVRWYTARALGEIKDPRAVEPLIAALGDERSDVRQAAAEALGKIKDPRAVEPLIAALGDERSDMRQAAAKALGAIGDARAMEPLIAALKDKDSAVRKAAAKALDHLGWKPAQDESAGWYWMAKRDWDKCVALGALAVEPLIAALKDENSDVRQAAAKALGKIGDPRAVEPLIAALSDESSDVRYAAAEALGKIKDPRAVEPLIAAHQNWWVGAAAACALGEIKDPRAVEPLIAALKDEDVNVRWPAARALGEIKDPRAVEPLIAALKDEELHVRWAAAEALVSLYRNASLSETAKQTILAYRSKITSPHSDGSSCGGHDDNGGIGVDFPL